MARRRPASSAGTGTDEKLVKAFTEAQDRLVLQASDLSLGTIRSMVASGAIDLEPQFQRRKRWKPKEQSELIESFLLNVPVPPVYLSEEAYGSYAVIDGKQRIGSIADFMSNELRLVGLKALEELNGRVFDELPDELRNALTIRPYLRAVTLLRQSDPNVKYEVFVRLNVGGESLNAQEIRNVAYRGPLNDLVYELGENAFLRERLKITSTTSSAYKMMQDAEMVLRFLVLNTSWESFSGSLRDSMDTFMRDHRSPGDATLRALHSSFERTIRACEELWGKAAFRRPHNQGWREQFLAGMYDAQMVAVSRLSDQELAAARSKKREVVAATRRLFKDRVFEAAVREATNTPSRIEYRVKKMFEALAVS